MRCGAYVQGALLALLLVMPAALQSQTTTVIVVRHAEKVDGTPESALSEAGRARADALAVALIDAGVETIYVTQYPRSRLTAEPLARRLGLKPRIVEAGGEPAAYAKAVVDRIRSEAVGRTVLVVGHSNTVPAIVAALNAGDVGSIDDPEHDHIFIVLLNGSESHVIRAGYPPR